MNRWIESKNSIKHRNDFDIASQKITRHTFFILCYPCEIFHGLVHGKCALKWYYLSLLYVCFSRFLNCTNGTKSRKTPYQNLLSIRENWKIIGSNLLGKLKIDGKPPRSGSVALRQLNHPIHKKGLESFL